MKTIRLYCALLSLAFLTAVAARGEEEAQQPAKTIVSATLDVQHVINRNLVWCNTFQLAWNELGHGFCGEALRLEGTPAMEKSLNAGTVREKDVDAESVFVKSGVATAALLDEINATLKKRFGDNAPAPLNFPLKDPAVLAYAYLFKNLAFKLPFEKQREALVWMGRHGQAAPLQGFGITKVTHNTPADFAAQVMILDKDEYIVELKTASADDRLILAMAQPKATLQETLDAVKERIRNARRKPFPIEVSDQFLAPCIKLNTERIYAEIIGKKTLNARLAGYSIAAARQTIRFNLDEKGAALKSEAEIRAAKNGHTPRAIVFNKPFLLYLERTGADNPYLVMWFENPELFTKSDAKPGRNVRPEPKK